MDNETPQQIGKKNRVAGADTERRVRANLEDDGWIVDKWRNNVKNNELVVAKNCFMKGRGVMLGSGFPDFIAFKVVSHIPSVIGFLYEVVGIECKSNGYLSAEEKEKCKWLLKNKVFSKILIASREKINNRIEIKYKEFKVKLNE